MALAFAPASLLGCFPLALNASLTRHLCDLPIALALAPALVASTPLHPFTPDTWRRAGWLFARYQAALLHRYQVCIAWCTAILGFSVDRSGALLLSGIASRRARCPSAPDGQL